jgi:hypothetical protein
MDVAVSRCRAAGAEDVTVAAGGRASDSDGLHRKTAAAETALPGMPREWGPRIAIVALDRPRYWYARRVDGLPGFADHVYKPVNRACACTRVYKPGFAKPPCTSSVCSEVSRKR